MVAQDPAKPEAAGAVTRTGNEVLLRLRGDWPGRVLKPGWAVLNGKFVLDVLPYRDHAGRPTHAAVLAVVPDYFGADPEHVPDPCLVYREAHASIDWDSGEPVLIFIEPPRL